MKLAWIAAPLILVAATWLQDQDQKIRDAVRDLASDKSEVREAAASTLRKIGKPALDALRKAAESEDPEVRASAKLIVKEIERGTPPNPPAQRAESVPQQRPSLRSGSVMVKVVNGDAIYTLTPATGDAITFHKRMDGGVKLEYIDEKGAKATAESDTLEKFLSEHKEAATKFGVSAEGIDHGGLRTSFSSMRFKLLGRNQDEDPLKDPADPGFEPATEEMRRVMEELRKAMQDPQTFEWPADGMFGASTVRGARVSAVPEVLRAQMAIPAGQGVVIDSVREGTTAAAIGLKKFDVILEIGGRKIGSAKDLREALTRDASVKVLRSGKESTLKAPPEEKKEQKEY